MMREQMIDTAKAITAGTVGIGVTFSDLEIGLRILVSAASFIFLCLQIRKLLREEKHKKRGPK